MPYYSNQSKENLSTAHQDLQTIFNYVIKHFDNTILYGRRLPEHQFELYMKGREQTDDGIVIVDRSKVVTYRDGYNTKSEHNHLPSRAVDSAPYPIDWEDEDRMYYYAGFVMGAAKLLKSYGAISHDIRWGGDWDRDTETDDQTFNDLVHFELI